MLLATYAWTLDRWLAKLSASKTTPMSRSACPTTSAVMAPALSTIARHALYTALGGGPETTTLPAGVTLVGTELLGAVKPVSAKPTPVKSAAQQVRAFRLISPHYTYAEMLISHRRLVNTGSAPPSRASPCAGSFNKAQECSK